MAHVQTYKPAISDLLFAITFLVQTNAAHFVKSKAGQQLLTFFGFMAAAMLGSKEHDPLDYFKLFVLNLVIGYLINAAISRQLKNNQRLQSISQNYPHTTKALTTGSRVISDFLISRFSAYAFSFLENLNFADLTGTISAVNLTEKEQAVLMSCSKRGYSEICDSVMTKVVGASPHASSFGKKIRALSLFWHPDKGNAAPNVSTQQTIYLNQVKDALRNR